MMNTVLQQAVDDVMSMGPAILMQGMQLERPIDVVRSHSLSHDDRRTILAAWASDLYAVVSKPAFRHLPGTPEPVSIDEIRSALEELDQQDGS
ncbi:hypothetical protein SB748_25705 [Rhizobium sp. SIMBA_035]